MCYGRIEYGVSHKKWSKIETLVKIILVFLKESIRSFKKPNSLN